MIWGTRITAGCAGVHSFFYSEWNLVFGQTCVHQLWLLGPQPSLSPSWEMLGGGWGGTGEG